MCINHQGIILYYFLVVRVAFVVAERKRDTLETLFYFMLLYWPKHERDSERRFRRLTVGNIEGL